MQTEASIFISQIDKVKTKNQLRNNNTLGLARLICYGENDGDVLNVTMLLETIKLELDNNGLQIKTNTMN